MPCCLFGCIVNYKNAPNKLYVPTEGKKVETNANGMQPDYQGEYLRSVILHLKKKYLETLFWESGDREVSLFECFQIYESIQTDHF